MHPEDGELLTSIRKAALEAGEIALAWFRADAETAARVEWKSGGSPVSEADYAVDRFLRERLSALVPEAGWLSEETADSPDRLQRERVFIVDPIDGTRGFIKGDLRWSISMALVEGGRPRVAVLHLPALGRTFEAVAGAGAWMNGEPLAASSRTTLSGGLIAGPQALLDCVNETGLQIKRDPRTPSLAYRLARVAAAEIDAAVASTDAWDWDIAAADLIVHEAGGLLTDLEGRAPIYNSTLPRHGVLGAAPQKLQKALIAALRGEARPSASSPGASRRDS